MRTEAVNYILTTYSATMFGDRASIHQMVVSAEVAKGLIGPATQIVATRASHENLAKLVFGQDMRVTRFADMVPEKSAILVHYRGAPIGDDGVPPEGSTVTFYLVESEEYQEPED